MLNQCVLLPTVITSKIDEYLVAGKLDKVVDAVVAYFLLIISVNIQILTSTITRFVFEMQFSKLEAHAIGLQD